MLEAVLVGAAGLAMALLSNAVSPRGLKLNRNYSPGHALAEVVARSGDGDTNAATANTGLVAAQLRTEGLQSADAGQVEQLFSDPKRAQELVVFIDARDDDHYQAGHIPGAYQLDHYHPEKYLAAALPACQAAETIVVYCKGGSCEDSEQTALLLRGSPGVPKDKLFVYVGGFDEWKTRRQPIELGQRNSGQTPGTPSGGSPANSAP